MTLSEFELDYLKHTQDNLVLNGMPKLMYAITSSMDDVVARNIVLSILNSGHDVNLVYKNSSALDMAVASRSPEFCAFLIDQGANVDDPLLSQPILHSACSRDKPETLALLLSRGADADVMSRYDKYNGRALHLAVLDGRLSCIDVLIAYGADINAIDSSGRTALHVAATNNRTDCVLKLLDHGADPTILDGGSQGVTAAQSAQSDEITILINSYINASAANANCNQNTSSPRIRNKAI